MLKTNSYHFNPVKLIEEMKKRPGLYSAQNPAERDEKVQLWREIAAALYYDWEKFNKATAYDRVLTLQRKWRCLRDAYNRELRSRKTGVRTNRREYIYFKKMLFLGGYDGEIAEVPEEPKVKDHVHSDYHMPQDPLSRQRIKKTKKKPPKSSASTGSNEHHETNMTACPIEMPNEGDSDRLYLLSFLPEMRQLPPNIKMWARAKIANIMQEAVAALYTETLPSVEIKSQRMDSSD